MVETEGTECVAPGTPLDNSGKSILSTLAVRGLQNGLFAVNSFCAGAATVFRA